MLSLNDIESLKYPSSATKSDVMTKWGLKVIEQETADNRRKFKEKALVGRCATV
jgi:hypothetical protein